MRLKKTRLILIYTRDYLAYASVISLLSFYVYSNTGNSALNIIFWFKLLTSVGGLLFHQKRKAEELFFYMNCGLGKRELMASSLVLDLGMWLIGMIILIN